MKKVIVIGCPGSGKSRLSREMHKITGLPLYHLDMMFWRADRTTVPREEFRAELRRVIDTDEWIIDGNYGSTMQMRMEACDTVIFLDFPTDVCLAGIEERRGKPRDDMPWIESDEDAEFAEFVRSYNSQSRPRVMELLYKYSSKEIIIFETRGAVDEYIKRLKALYDFS
ncbi:MAG: adenylate kinase [Clostridia bacterium]|nr:adenylate kinase [Clostridia bacterium]